MLCSLFLKYLYKIYKMCDNNNSSSSSSKNTSLFRDNIVNRCGPCANDTLACQTNTIRHVMANNVNIMECFKNIKCQILSYINSVSAEFIQHVDESEDDLERNRFNVLIESLIAGIHQSCRSHTNGQIEPYFQLYIQQHDIDSSGNVIDNTTTFDLGSGSSSDVTPNNGNVADLYPNKLSLFSNCNLSDGTKGDEILYYFIPSIQLLYDSQKSGLQIKWGDADYTQNNSVTKKCLFPLIVAHETYKWRVYDMVPVTNDSTWQERKLIYNYLREDVLLKNNDLISFISQLDIIIRKCEITHSSLKLKLKMAAKDVVTNVLDSSY